MSEKIPPVVGSTPPPPPKKRRWLLYGCGGLLALLLLLVATVAITIWWMQRPIKPVVLTPKEQTVVDQKLRVVESAKTTTPNSTPELAELPAPINAPPVFTNSKTGGDRPTAASAPAPAPERTYVPGDKKITLTEREVNGLLNKNTDLGKSLRLEFAQDAINAYLVVPIPQDFPIAGGKMFRARGRFRLSLGNGGTPYAVLEDVTIFGVSLPKAWLGGLKGENLLGDAVGQQKGGPVLRGIRSLRIEPGALVLELQD